MIVLRHVNLSIENGRVAFLDLSSSHQRHQSPQAMTIIIVTSMRVKPIADSHENFRCRNEIANPINPKSKPTSDSRTHWRDGRTVLPGEKSMGSLHDGNEYPKRPRRVTMAKAARCRAEHQRRDAFAATTPPSSGRAESLVALIGMEDNLFNKRSIIGQDVPLHV